MNSEFFFGALDEVRVFGFAPGAFYPGDLLVTLQPPAATTLAATETGDSFGTIHGTVVPNNLATAVWFEWGPSTSYGSNTASTVLTGTTVPLDISATLNGLSLEIPIHYRVAASNLVGISYGADASFTPSLFSVAPFEGLPQALGSSMAWGDYDNDGRLDLLFSGNFSGGIFSQLWRNTGGGFSNVTATAAAGIPGVFESSVSWGDFDNDGYLDFLITGNPDGGTRNLISQIWHNNGTGTFSNVTARVASTLPGVYGSAAAWADYDNDGHLDFLLIGDAVSRRVAQLWRNNGNGTFSDVTTLAAPGLIGVYQGSVAWGDYDNDGHLDFILTGHTDLAGAGTLQLRRNNGDGTFSDVSATVASDLPRVHNGNAVWADYDNDGRLDIFVTGLGVGRLVSELWRNTGAGFTNVSSPDLPPLRNAKASWVDYDSDGRQDLLLAGESNASTGSTRSELWRNTGSGFTRMPSPRLPGLYDPSLAWGDFDNDGRPDLLWAGTLARKGSRVTQLWRNTALRSNTPPSAPTGLAMTATTNAAMLSWNAATDAQTPATGLTYNVRAGSKPGGTDLFAGHVDATNGFRRVPAMGNAYLRHSLPLRGLTNGQTVYWSVQAVDTSFAGGPFATETSEVTIPKLVIRTHSAPSTLSISWTPPTWGWTLQELGDLSTAAWTNSPSGELNPATVSSTNGINLYRLFRP